MNENNENNELPEEVEKDIKAIFKSTLYQVISCADKYNLDRDDCINYFTDILEFINSIATFKDFKIDESEE